MRKTIAFAAVILLSLSMAAFGAEPIKNWAAPSSWTPPSARATGRSALVTYPPLPFIPITPCRVADTRGNGFTGQYGPPFMSGGAPRNFTITGQCGIPASAEAVSFNFTVTNTAGPGFLKVFPQGGSSPTVSTMNYLASQTIANAAVVPLGTGGGLTAIPGVSGFDLIIDVNGFYGPTPTDQTQAFTLANNSTGYTMFLTNASTTCGGACGTYQSVMSGTALWGDAFGTTSAGHGVYGYTASTSGSNAGVRGVAQSSNSFGVYGTNSGASTVGVKGSANHRGVEGDATADGSCGVCGFGFSGGTGSSGVSAFANGSTFPALHVIGDFSATGTKSFLEPDPTDASKQINYIAIESPEPRTFFTGRGRFENGTATITVPDHFRSVTAEEGLTVQITPIGMLANVAVLDVSLNQIVIQSNRQNIEFFYTVSGIRASYQNHRPVEPNVVFRPDSPGGHDVRKDLSPGAISAMIKNGTLNPDGTWNVQTARAFGWKIPESK